MSAPAPALDPQQIILGLNNGPGIYLAPEGTDPPADLTAAWPAPWVPLGYLSDDGVTVSASTDSDTLTPWQSTSPIRTVITGKTLSLQFVLWQTNPTSLGLYFDTEIPTVTDGVVDMEVRSDGGGLVYAIGIDIRDNATTTRISFTRASLSDTGDVTVARGSAVGWDCTLTALDDNGVLGHILSGTQAVESASPVTVNTEKAA